MGEKKLFESGRIEKLVAVVLIGAAVFMAAKAIDAVGNLFDPRPIQGNAISVSGTGTVTAIPDVATISFSVSEEAQTVALAQEESSQKINTALALLKDSVGIDESDIKTTSYNAYPKFSYTPCYERYCPPINEQIVGYTVSQSVEVKVRDLEKVSAVLSSLGEAGVANLSGPSFTVDDMDSLRAEARDAAVKDAHEKARMLSKSLGVRLVRVIGFWENEPSYPYYRMEGYGGDMAVSSAAPAPQLPPGENEIMVSISVSYEIR